MRDSTSDLAAPAAKFSRVSSAKDHEVVMMRRAPRRARAAVAAAAEVVDAFCRAGRHSRQAGEAGRQPVDEPVGEGAARGVGVEHLDGQLLGARWRRAPLQAGAPVRAVAGELAQERAPRKVRAGDREREGISLTGTVNCRTSTCDQRGEMMVIVKDELAMQARPEANEAEQIRAIERKRLRALVRADMPVAQSLHAADFQLVNPHGGILSKEEYLGGIASGEIDYRQFEPVSDIKVITAGAIAVIRYQSQIDIDVQGQTEFVRCWHTDCYRRGERGWQVVWSQATVAGPGEASSP